MDVERSGSINEGSINSFVSNVSTDRFHGAFKSERTGSASPRTGSPGGARQLSNQRKQSQTPDQHLSQSPSLPASPTSPTTATNASSTAHAASASASATTVAGPPAAPGLNPRSCVTCRKRKVKCDKKQPCSNCSRAHVECVFPRPGRAPRRSKKPPDAELLLRLRRLEGVVQKLGKGVEKDYMLTPEGSLSPPSDAKVGQQPRQGSVDDEVASPASMGPDGLPVPAKPGSKGSMGGTLKIEKEMGDLVLGEGKSRYVSNTFWASLTEEVAEMKDLVVETSEEEYEGESVELDGSTPDSLGSHATGGRHTHQEFVFGYSSTMGTLRMMHPHPKEVETYWRLYVENVDPVVRLLHKPTAQQIFAIAAKDPSELSKTTEVLVFAVYYAVVTSLGPESCLAILGVERQTLLSRYRFCTEQALARANFLATHELIVVQAFCLFLCCVRRQDETKAIWTLTGLLLRMATSLGLHRDGTSFGLPPFQTEMRRRLWWQVCTLDVRASEDQGADPLITLDYFDTRMPLNINDEDIWPNMTEPPVEHEKCTEMTFDLVRYEIGGTIRLLSSSQGPYNKYPEQRRYETLEEKEALLERLRLRLEDKYLRHCDMTVPLQWVSANVARLVMAKIWLVIHHPFRHGKDGVKLSQDVRDRTFLTSIDVIRYSRMLQTQQKTVRWGWLFRTYFQWHAVAFLLSELCVRASGPAVDEAWAIIDEAFPDWEKKGQSHRRSILWKPIAKLIIKARAVRAAELERQKMFPRDGTLGVMPLYSSLGTGNNKGGTNGSLMGSEASNGALTSPSTSSVTCNTIPTPASSINPMDKAYNTGDLGAKEDPFYLPLLAAGNGATQPKSENINEKNSTTINDPSTITSNNNSIDPILDFDPGDLDMDMGGMGMWFDDPTLGQDSNWEFNNILPWGNFTEGGPQGVGPPPDFLGLSSAAPPPYSATAVSGTSNAAMNVNPAGMGMLGLENARGYFNGSGSGSGDGVGAGTGNGGMGFTGSAYNFGGVGVGFGPSAMSSNWELGTTTTTGVEGMEGLESSSGGGGGGNRETTKFEK